MKTITMMPAWAWLVVHGYKDVENRSWSTKHRGPLAIHAGKKMTRRDYRTAVKVAEHLGAELPPADQIARSSVVGVVTLVECFRCDGHCSRAWHNHEDYGFLLADAVAFKKPFPLSGKLGIFEASW